MIAGGETIAVTASRAGVSRETVRKERVAMVAAGAPTGGTLPFSGQPSPAPATPTPAWNSTTMAPPPNPLTFTPGYSDHTYSAFAEPLNFQGWDIARVRQAIFLHRQGIFLESAVLAQMVISFPPVYAALFQRVAPALSLPRRVKGGATGLSGFLRARLEEAMVPSDGLTPSPYFPPELYGAMGIDLALPGFSVLQHVMGDPDPDTGERDLYTRRWPTYAVTYYTNRRTFVATTDSEPVDVCNDGKFTLVADVDTPHLYGALLALGEEALDGKQTQRARAQWINRYGDPKLAITMPQQVPVRGEEGQAFFRAAQLIRNPDGFGIFPYGSKVEWTALSAAQSTAFDQALASNLMMVAIALVGTDGTVESGTGGVYTSPTASGVVRRHAQRDLAAEVRGANLGHVKTWVAFNYSGSIREAQAAGEVVVMPALDIPLPDPDADARIKSVVERTKAVTDQIVAARAANVVVDQAYVDALCTTYSVSPMTLAEASAAPVSRIELAPTDVAVVIRGREARASQGLAPFGDERDDMTIFQLKAQSEASAVPGAALPGNLDAPPGSAAPEDDTLPPDESAATLAADMTAHKVTECEHGKKNRCRICGVEREREVIPGKDGAPHTWAVKWRAIPKPGDKVPAGEEPIDQPSDDPTAPVAAPEDDGAQGAPATEPKEGKTP